MTKLIRGITWILLFWCTGVSATYAQPINDDYTGAITIPVTPNRQYANYSNQLASGSDVSPPDCGSYEGSDVWFKLILPDAKIKIDLANTSSLKFVVALYTKNSGQLEEFSCSSYGAPSDPAVGSRITFNPIADSEKAEAGDEIYVRVFRYGSTSYGSFQISAYLQNGPAVLNDVCSQAHELTNNNGTFEFQSFNTENAAATNGLQIPSGCSGCDKKDIWFKSEVPMSGKLIIETNPGTITPAIMVYTDACDELNEYAFSKTGTRDNGGEIKINDLDLAGKAIFIRAISVQSGGGTFSIAVLEPQQDVCADAIKISEVSLIENYVGYTNQYATVDGSEPTCGVFTEKDIWFLIRVPSNGNLVIDTKVDSAYGIKPVLTAYTGSCENLVQYACDFFGSTTNAFGAKIEINDPELSNQYIYLRMYGYDNSDGGRFEMATIQPTALPVDLVAFTPEVINNEEVSLDWQTASELNNDHFIVEHSTDGKDYTPVAHIKGKGTTSERQTYQFRHDEPFFGENYYRLKQVDFDGQFEYSKIVIAVIKMEETKINVYPNPAVVTGGISIRWNGDFGVEKVQLSITNAFGRQVVQQTLHVEYERQVYVDFSRLKLDAGHYYLTISDKNSLITHQKLNLIKD